MATATAHHRSPFNSGPSQSHPFSTSPVSHSAFQLRPISPHPHFPQLPPHPQPSPERRIKHEVEKERITLDRSRERRDGIHIKNEDKSAPRELRRLDQLVRDERESRERERAERERAEMIQRGQKDDDRERERDVRRPLTPSSLRDINLPISPLSPSSPNGSSSSLLFRDPNSKLPLPPTGHDLMAMFPAPSPYFAQFSGKSPVESPISQRTPPHESTSGYFQRQERAFFAQAGREIVRVRLEIDSAGLDKHQILPLSSPNSSHLSPDSPRYQLPPHPHPHASSPNGGSGTPPPGPMEGVRLTSSSDGMEVLEGPDDESWRRPMPYAERRRAGKHTRRVVRN